MDNKINICTCTESAFLKDELERFRQFISQNAEDMTLFSSQCKQENITDYLHTAKASAVLLPLHDLPVQLPDGISIAALSPRYALRETLVIKYASIDLNLEFRVKRGAAVFVSLDRQRFQLSSIRPDLIFVDSKELADAFFSDVSTEIPDGMESVLLNPKEFLPQPGYGVFAWLTLTENISLRKLLKTFHHKETAVLTNIERKISKINGYQDINISGAYAWTGHDNNIHLYAGAVIHGGWASKRISQTSVVSICENLLEELSSTTIHS